MKRLVALVLVFVLGLAAGAFAQSASPLDTTRAEVDSALAALEAAIANDRAATDQHIADLEAQIPPPSPSPSPDPTVFVAPVLSVSVTGSDVHLTWTDSGPEDEYAVRVSTTGADGAFSLVQKVGANVLSFDILGLADGTRFYRIQAQRTVAGVVERANSNVVEATTPAPGTSPSPSPSPDPSPSPSPSPEPTPTPDPLPDPTCDVSVPAGGNIDAAADAAAQGAVICLSGTYNVNGSITPKDGQTFKGPATIVGANDSVDGFALAGVDADDVTLIDLNISGFNDAVNCWEGTQIFGGRLHHNTGNGVGCGLQYVGGRTVLVDGVEIDHNGDPSDLGVGAGGIKIARLGTGDFTLRDSWVHDNLGNGVWCDVQCVGIYLIVDNLIERNGRKGIHYEKSGASDEYAGVGQVCLGCGLPVVQGQAIVRSNTVRNNGTEGREFAADGGIVNVSSRNMLIENNVTSGTPRGGIIIRQDSRLSGEKHGWVIQNVVIRNNIANDGIVGCSLAGVTCEGNT